MFNRIKTALLIGLTLLLASPVFASIPRDPFALKTQQAQTDLPSENRVGGFQIEIIVDAGFLPVQDAQTHQVKMVPAVRCASGRLYFISADPMGIDGGVNLYAYGNLNPLAFVDPYGLYAGIDDAVFAGGGAIVGIIGQGVSDLISGKLSGWEDYVGSAIGGAVAGETLLYAGPIAAGAAGGAAGNISKQIFKNASGKQDGANVGSFVLDTTIGAATGLIPGSKIPGITSGQGSANAVFKQMTTKFANGSISSVSGSTAVKMFVGRGVDTALVPGAAGSGLASGLISQYFTPTDNSFGSDSASGGVNFKPMK